MAAKELASDIASEVGDDAHITDIQGEITPNPDGTLALQATGITRKRRKSKKDENYRSSQKEKGLTQINLRIPIARADWYQKRAAADRAGLEGGECFFD